MTEIVESVTDVSSLLERRDQNGEKEVRQAARKRYFEALRPDPTEAATITSLVTSALRDALKADPNSEHKRILGIGAGIYLWELGLHDTGNSLPVGLAFSVERNEELPRYGTNDRDMINFDTNVFTHANYAYVTKILRDKEVLKKVLALEDRHKQEKRGELIAATENLIRHSPFMDYLDSFKIDQEDQETDEFVPLTPENPQWKTEKGNLEREFIAQWGRLPGGGKPDPILRAAYRRDVEQRLARLQVPADIHGTEQNDKVRERFREKMRTSILAVREKLHKEWGSTPAEEVIVREYEQLDGSTVKQFGYVLADGTFDRTGINSIIWDEITPLNDELHFWNLLVSKNALERLAPYIYDPTDPRSLEEIVDEQLPQISEEVVNSHYNVYSWASDRQERETAWLTDAYGPVRPVMETEDWHEHSGGIQNTWRNLNQYSRYGSRYYIERERDANFSISRDQKVEQEQPKRKKESLRKRAYQRARRLSALPGMLAALPEALVAVPGMIAAEYRESRDPLGPGARVQEGSVHIPNAKETDRDRQSHFGEVKSATPEVFAGVQQRLITRKKRDGEIPQVETDAQRYHYAEAADAVIEAKSRYLANEREDPVIEGMDLIARDKEKGWYFYKIDQESTIHDRIEKKLRPIQQIKLVQLCDSAGMHELADKIQDAEEPSISDFIDLARPYMIAYIPEKGGKQFTVNKVEDFLTNGSIDSKGNLRGVCDSFERFIHLTLAAIEGEDSVSLVDGLSFHNGVYIDKQLHAKTRYWDRESGKVYIIDMEPDPSKSEIATSGYEKRVVDVPEKKEIPLTQDEDEETPAQKDEEVGKILLAEEQIISIPEPPPLEQGFQEAIERERKEKEAAASVALFEQMLTAYLTGENTWERISNEEAFDAFRREMHGAMQADLHQGEAYWTKIPHILIYSLIRQYEQWRLNPQEDKDTYHMEEVDLDEALALIKRYKEAEARAGEISIGSVSVPRYNTRFAGAMERAVAALGSLSENNKFYALTHVISQ